MPMADMLKAERNTTLIAGTLAPSHFSSLSFITSAFCVFSLWMSNASRQPVAHKTQLQRKQSEPLN